MGQPIDFSRFQHQDFRAFRTRLEAENQLLHDLIEGRRLSDHAPMAGLELEAWLVDGQGRPAPRNAEFLARVDNADVVSELGRFNVEINVPPRPVAGDGLARLAGDLRSTWSRCSAAAEEMGLHLMATGILPSLRDGDLTLANLTDSVRYRALNEQAARQRRGRTVQLDIEGADGRHLRSEHRDVMLEAAATSFQVHLQVPQDQIVRAYNAALIAAGPVLAAAGNSPLLFGQALWQETRIPLFEQALGLVSREDGLHAGLPRVGLGSGYAGYSLMSVFRENAERFEPLLPVSMADVPPQQLPHLRLHNGTIWRWVRPLVGFDAPDGRTHLRIEHRPLPAGPSIVDMLANLAFTIGAIHQLSTRAAPPEAELPFESAASNLQAAARDGLASRLHWWGNRRVPASEVVVDLLAAARQGLADLQVDADLAARWLDVIARRVATRRTGARWQLARLQLRRGDLSAMTRDYATRQSSGEPVHEWS